MHTEIDYSKSPAPAFDAVQDVIKYFGPKWPEVTKLMAGIKDPVAFQNWAGFAGVEGAPVRYWYEHYNGGDSWAKAWSAKRDGTLAAKCSVCDGAGEVWRREVRYDVNSDMQIDEGDFVPCVACNGTGVDHNA